MFDDLDRKISDLGAKVDIAKAEIPALPEEDRHSRGWWIHGAGKMLGKYGDVKAARAYREHRFIIHEDTGRHIYAVCACGASFRGELHEDFTLEQFPRLPGHLDWDDVRA